MRPRVRPHNGSMGLRSLRLRLRSRWRRWLAVLVVAALAASGTVIGVQHLLRTVTHPPPSCTLGSGAAAFMLAPDQAADATTIAAVATRMRLPDHAVTVALATSLQESKLHNYPFGDRDSLGLFQQRPSQGWGKPAQLLTPAYAAAAFYRHLSAVPGWRSLPVAVAAQAVQHSADGSAYAQWEELGRALARALTGEVQAGMSCRFDNPGPGKAAALSALADQELGPGALHRRTGSVHADWTVAQWLLGHAYSYGIVEVTVRGQAWTNGSGAWRVDRRVGRAPSYRLAPARSG
jgi:hypothetical protein